MARSRGKLKSVKGAKGAAPSELPLSPDVWEADLVPLPEAAVAGVPGGTGLTVAIAAEAGSELVVGTEVGQWTDEAEAIADVVLGAMTAPMAGNPRRPSAVRVRRTDAADVLVGRLPDGIDVEFADTLPAVDAVVRGLDEFLLGGPSVGGSAPLLAAMEDFFDAAADFYEAAPWRRIDERTPLEISIGGAAPLYAIVLGEDGELHGLALHDSPEDLLDPTSGGRDESDVRLVFYVPESDFAPAIAEQRKLRRWRVAGPAAFPVLVRRLADGSEPEPDVDDLRIATAALRATRVLGTNATPAELAEPGEVKLLVGQADRGPTGVRIAWHTRGSPDRHGRPGASHGASEPETLELFPDLEETDDVVDDDRMPELEELIHRITRLPRAQQVFRRLVWTFFRAPEPLHVEEPEMDDAMARFSEWAMFSARPAGKPTLAEQALRKAAKQLGEERVAGMRAVAHPRHSLYRVEKVDDEGLTMLDVLRSERVRVRVPGTRGEYHKGDMFVGNLFRAADGDYRFGSTLTSVEGRVQPDAEPPDEETAAVQAEGVVFGASPNWIFDLPGITEVRDAWGDFQRALGDTGAALPSFGSLQKQIRTATEPVEVLATLTRPAWWSFEEAEVCTAFIHHVWNLTPRDELGGRSPQKAFDEDDAEDE